MPAPSDFEDVRAIGREAEDEPAWAEYAAYCRFRADGLRKPALAALDRFIAEAGGWGFEDRRAFVLWIAERRDRVWVQGVVLPEPLIQALVWPTLEAWVEREPTDPRPHLLRGQLRERRAMVTSSEDDYRRALALDPGCAPPRLALATALLGRVDFSQHHLPDGYIGDPEEDLALLAEAEALLADVQDDAKTHLLREIGEYRLQAVHWRDHGRAPEGMAPRSRTFYFEP